MQELCFVVPKRHIVGAITLTYPLDPKSTSHPIAHKSQSLIHAGYMNQPLKKRMGQWDHSGHTSHLEPYRFYTSFGSIAARFGASNVYPPCISPPCASSSTLSMFSPRTRRISDSPWPRLSNSAVSNGILLTSSKWRG